MPHKRLIARLDIKGDNVIKGIQMDGLRVVGAARGWARKYYEQGADEIIMVDIVASLYGRDALAEIIRDVTTDCFVPVTVGGGIRTLADADVLFRAGADRVAVNTAAVNDPSILTRIADKYGSQAVVVQLDAKRKSAGAWEVYTDAGRNATGLDVLDWVERAIEASAGEIFVTSVDRDGTRKGMEVDLIATLVSNTSVPVTASGGVGSVSDIVNAFQSSHCSGIAVGAALHSGALDIPSTRDACRMADIDVRAVVAP